MIFYLGANRGLRSHCFTAGDFLVLLFIDNIFRVDNVSRYKTPAVYGMGAGLHAQLYGPTALLVLSPHASVVVSGIDKDAFMLFIAVSLLYRTNLSDELSPGMPWNAWAYR